MGKKKDNRKRVWEVIGGVAPGLYTTIRKGCFHSGLNYNTVVSHFKRNKLADDDREFTSKDGITIKRSIIK